MKIYKINTQSNYRQSDIKSNPIFCTNPLKPITIDTFKTQYISLDSAISKLKNFTKLEYDSLTLGEKQLLRKELYNPIKETYISKNIDKKIRIHHYAEELVKQTFDKAFGENNYEVIIPGRSLATIGKILEFKIGKNNVKNIPISRLRMDYSTYEDWQKQQEIWHKRFKYSDLAEYLNSINLNKEIIKNSNKKYIIIDFSATGNSLKNVYNILTSDELLSNPDKKIIKTSINDIIKGNNKNFNKQLMVDLFLGNYKKYSHINQCLTINKDTLKNAQNCTSFLNKYNSHDKDKSLRTIKIFQFGLLDSFYGEGSIPNFNIKIKDDTITYIGQKKLPWINRKTQLLSDIHDDTIALFKLMDKLDKNSHSVKSKLLFFKYELTKYTNLLETNHEIETIDYYTNFRPKFEQFINIMS